MAIEFKLPEVSEGVESADVAEIHVAEGDVVEADQIVLEVETEKAVADIPCPHAGKVAKVHVSEGDTINVGDVLLTIEETSESKSTEESEPSSGDEGASAESPGDVEESTKEKPEEKPEQNSADKSSAPDRSRGKSEPGDNGPQKDVASRTAIARVRDDEAQSRPPAPAAPATRRMAREFGVDLFQVAGSGPGGRITRDDVQTYVRTLIKNGSSREVGSSVGLSELPDFTQWGPVERQRLSKLARTTARNMSLAWRTIPHVTQHDLADVTDVEAARRGFMQRIGKNGPKVTMTAVIIKACVAALKAYPQFNASLDHQTDELVLKRYYHIGVAVDTEAGLLVPVIRDCDQKSILDIAGELTELAEKARERRLSLDQMQGASFTITNLGGIGGTHFTPIVNYPEVAILGMSRSRKELSIEDGEIAERLMLPISLSYDHRVVNGADAARFVVKLSNVLADSFQLLIES